MELVSRNVTFNKRSPEDTAQLRKDFSKVRKDLIEDGLVPDGWQVHHKLPLDQGGTNDLENLVLIKNDPYHKVITNEQN